MSLKYIHMCVCVGKALFLAALESFPSTQFLYLVVAMRPLFVMVCGPSYCRGCSYCRTWALGTWASVAVAPGLWSTDLVVTVHGLGSCSEA